MGDKIFDFFKKNLKKHHLILLGIGLIFVLVGVVSWNVYFSKYYIFEQQEKYFLETVKDYYEFHSVYLPKEDDIKTLTLENLYEMGQIEAINYPKSNKLCNTDSWVKVYNDGKDYHYYVYLKCGKYESKVDHEGPVITLKGDDTIYVSLNKEYKELGIEKVVDDVDGNIDVSKVVINNSKVNTKKVGKYNVTYTVRDTLNNETKVTRKVVVARNLTDEVKDNTNESNYYQGNVDNNYILFSGMLYRIINVNSDGTVRLISNENLNNLRMDIDTYENSNIDLYLTNEYLNIIHDPSYLVDSEFCIGNIESREQVNAVCDQKITRKVGILSYQDFLDTLVNGSGYLCTPYNYALANKISGSILTAGGDNNCTAIIENSTLPSIRPVITLKSNLIILSGDGTREKPYKLDDYDYGNQQDKINTRVVGEYVNYSGMSFRIMGIDKNKDVKLIATDAMKVSNTNQFLLLSVPEIDSYRFNTKNEDNTGYIINNQFIDYINDSYLVKTKYKIPLNVSSKKYSDYENSGSGEAKLILPTTYDLFAGVQTNNSSGMYLYLDASNQSRNVFYVNAVNGRVFEDTANIFGEYAVKIITTVQGDLLIRSGKGTLESPYYIR